MEKIIYGQKYDTEKSRCIGAYETDETDFDRNPRGYREELYRTKSGKYFLAGEGGALSDYAAGTHGGGWCPGSKIIPISEDDALNWCEKNLDKKGDQ